MAENNENAEGADSPSFETALARLEQVVGRLEDGQLGLAEALAEYEQGVQMLQQCNALLEHAERRIDLLTGVDADGNPILQPFSERADSTQREKKRSEPQKGRSGARKSRPAAAPEPPDEGSRKGDFDVDAPASLF